MPWSRVVPIGLSGFLAGVLGASFFDEVKVVWLLASALGVAVIASMPRQYRWLALLAWGLFSGGLFLTHDRLSLWRALPEKIVFDGRVRIVVIEEERVFYRPVTLAPIDCGEHCPEGRILYRAPLLFEARPGDLFSFRCELRRPENFDPDFDYRSYLAAQGVGYVCEREGEATFIVSPHWSLARTLFTVREKVASAMRKALPEPAAGLALGLTLGGNDFLAREMKDTFARTGLSHIVAVSGYNMTLLVQFVLIFGLMLGLWRKQALFLSMGAIVFFLLLIGAPASALRAALMTGAGFGAFLFGRLPASSNALLLAASLMLVANPLLLRFDVGFQLSFLATLALIVIGPVLETFLPLSRLWAKGAVIILSTIAIELFTLPVLLGTFGQATWLAPLTNLLVLPLVPLAMLLAIFLLPLFFVLPSVSPLLALPLWSVLSLQVWVAESFAQLPFGLVSFRGFGAVGTLAWYGLLLLGCHLLFKWQQRYVLGLAHQKRALPRRV